MRYQIVYCKSTPLITWEATEADAWARVALLERAGYACSLYEHRDDGSCIELTHRYAAAPIGDASAHGVSGIPPRTYGILRNEMQHYADPASYASDLAQSSIWGDAPEPAGEAPSARVQLLRDMWAWQHMSAADLLQASGCTIPQLSQALGIPPRTVADWVSGAHKCPQYIIAMAAELLARRARA